MFYVSSFYHIFKEEVDKVVVVGDFCILTEVFIKGAVDKVFKVILGWYEVRVLYRYLLLVFC